MKTRMFFFILGIMAIGPSFAYAADVAGLRAQIQEITQKALVVREQVRKLAFENPTRSPSIVFGQPQVALQVGHWKIEEAPWELRALDPARQAQGGGKMEWEIGLAIAQETAKLLEAQGIGVVVLPATLPSIYEADVFVSIHADQNPNLPYASGFKVAASVFDQSGKARRLAQLLKEEYRNATWLDEESYIPKSMPYYYAFNSGKFLYAVHPTTPAVIIETGYLPNPRDRAIILSNPHMAAKGIAQGIVRFLQEI
ncbi:MAG TPA: N-acetylmuramoyl-L-alanine amidase [Candidatus Paceibacterota bacterium]